LLGCDAGVEVPGVRGILERGSAMTRTASTGVGSREPAPTALLDDVDATLFPKLTEAHLRMLSPLGQVQPTEKGEVLVARIG
jgi:hypothetical protein